MSLPEIRLLLARASVKRARELVEDTQSRFLASGAKWNQKIAARLNEFQETLCEIFDPQAPKFASKQQLLAVFGRFGIKQQPE